MKYHLPKDKRIVHEDGEQTRFSISYAGNQLLDRDIVTVMLFDHWYNRPHVGVAVCHPNDPYDPGIGKRLAFQRAFEDWMRCNPGSLINYALGMNVSIDEARKDLWKTLGSSVYSTCKRMELTDGKLSATNE